MEKMLLDSEVLYCLEKCNEYDCDRDKCAMVDVDNSCKAWEESIRVIRGLLNDKEKYRWHDLRKNPDDLPKEDGAYWVYGDWGSGKKSEGECEFHVHDGYFRTSWNFNVIAWKYVEPFKEEN